MDIFVFNMDLKDLIGNGSSIKGGRDKFRKDSSSTSSKFLLMTVFLHSMT